MLCDRPDAGGMLRVTGMLCERPDEGGSLPRSLGRTAGIVCVEARERLVSQRCASVTLLKQRTLRPRESAIMSTRVASSSPSARTT